MVKCPICGTENDEGVVFCKKCGARISVTVPSQTQSQPAPNPQPAAQKTAPAQVMGPEDGVKAAVVKRLDALKNKDENAVKEAVDEGYSKFDDWAPYRRQEHDEALSNEFSAFKVLLGYTYEVKDFKATVLGDVALATYTIHYQATMNKDQYDVISRVTTVLKRSSGAWKVLHEHFSRYMDNPTPQGQNGRRRGRFPF